MGCTRVCQSSVGSSNQNYRLKHICRVYQGVPIICGVLQSKLQAQTHLWGVPGCPNHLWGPPIEITGTNTSVGCTNHLWGPPIEITGSNTSVRCIRVCQSSVGSSNWNYRLKHICEVYQGVPIICGCPPIICGVLQLKLQAQTHLWGVPGCANHLWGPPIEITGSNTSVGCTRVSQSSVGSSNWNYRHKHICGVYQSPVGFSNWNYRLKHICGVYQGVPIICGVLQSKLQAQTHLWGVPGCANHLWGPPIEITGTNTSVGCTRVCQSSVGSSNQNYKLKRVPNLFILFLNYKLSIYRSIYKSNHSFPTILYKTESRHQKYALKLWLWLVLLLSGSSLLVKDGDKQNFKVHITSLLHVASSKSRDEVFLQVAF